MATSDKPREFTEANYPQLVKRRSGEKVQSFILRAEQKGVERMCTNCRMKRRFSQVTCTACGRQTFVHVKGKTPKDLPDLPDEEVTAEVENSQGYQFERNPELDEADDKTTVVVNFDEIPLDGLTVAELKEYALAHDIDLGGAKTKKAILEVLRPSSSENVEEAEADDE